MSVRRATLAFAIVALGLLLVVPEARNGFAELMSSATHLVDRQIARLNQVDPVVLYGVAAILTALEASLLIGLFLPGDVVVLLLGTTATSPGKFALAVGTVAIGSVFGEIVGYSIGRRFEGVLRRTWMSRKIGACRWQQAERFFHRKGGGPAVFGARFVAAAHALVPIVAGSVRMPQRVFLSWTAAGAVTWSLLYVSAGALAGNSAQQGSGSSAGIGYVMVALAILIWVPTWLIARRTK